MPETLTLDPKQISDVLQRSISQFKAEVGVQEVGEVIDCGDGIARVKGLPNCLAEEMLEFPNNVYGVALNLERENVGVMLLGDFTKIAEGDIVKRTGRALLRLLQNPTQCKSFGEHSFHLAQERYSWRAVGERVRESILNTLQVPDFEPAKPLKVT